VSLLDTGTVGDSLDAGRTFTLPASYGGISGRISGVAITPDGTRILVGVNNAGPVAGEGAAPTAVSGGIMAYGAADGKPVGVVYRDSEGGRFRLLDIDGTGENALVGRAGEIGAVGASGYRTLAATGQEVAISQAAW
jgi:hypothetical protein